MKVCVIQPAYSTDYSKIEYYYNEQMKLLAQCDDSMDLIVLPESADTPCRATTREEAEAASDRFNKPLLEAVRQTAIRCNAMVFVNGRSHGEKGLRNTTYCFDRQGNIAGTYFKQHLTPGEVSKFHLDSDYTYEPSEPTVVEIEGIRFGFLTCYDFYFYEAFANMARQKLDVIIGCSHQRSDTHQSLQISSQFLAYNTNAYVVRSSVSMDENSHIGGGSMVVAPNGDVLLNMESRVGLGCVDIDVSKKYYKPAGFGNAPSAHYEYMEKGRRPWKYRPAGPAMVPDDNTMPYPRTCSHRGFNSVAPENSMSAYGAAVAMGAQEIEFDLWWTKDGQIVSCHDRKLERLSNGTGFVTEHTYEELLQLDFGIKFGKSFEGLRILTFEQILQKLACQVIMNIHIKSIGNDAPLDEGYLRRIIDLIYKYDCQKHVYFMTGNDYVQEQLARLAPQINRCVGAGKDHWGIVDRAIRFGAKKVQLFKPDFDQAMIHKAHENGIVCNIFWSDDPEETKRYLDMGIDTILTNDFHINHQVISQYPKYRF